METENKKILLVEDDPNFGTVLKDYLAMNDTMLLMLKTEWKDSKNLKKEIMIFVF